MQAMNDQFHTSRVLKTTHILSETFFDAIGNKGVTPGGNMRGSI
jgi:hypothetical protein